MKLFIPLKDREGFTLLELLLAVVISAMLILGIYRTFGTCQNIQSAGVDMAAAQQNARIALETLETDIRLAGHGIPAHIQAPIVVGSEYRVTFVRDLNDNGLLDLGETITYFLDRNTSDFIASVTPNPRDMVLRRVVSDSLNPGAAPISGYGDVVSSNITQQIDNDGRLDVPMFTYYDDQGNLLLSSGSSDPFSAALGYTVPDSLLGRPPGGPYEAATSRIRVAIVAESEARDEFLRDYRRVSLSTTITPRNLAPNHP